MADLTYEIQTEWSGTGREGEGKVKTGGYDIVCSGPENMGGKGVGTSPEELLMSGVTSCYSGTLVGVLKRAGLPVSKVEVRAQGIVTDYPLKAKFGKLIVNPTIVGGDSSRAEDYAKAAKTARERCFIGKTVFGNVEYTLGTVKVVPEA